MSITFLALADADHAKVRDLLVKFSWKRDWTEETANGFFSWRYLDRPHGDALVAFDDGRCVGILDSFLRPYRIGRAQETVRETCDWYCLPEYRSLGLGLHLMRRVMRRPEPIVVVGGTSDTQELLPRLKWMRLPDVEYFFLGVSAKTLAELIARRRSWAALRLARFVPDIPLTWNMPRFPAPSSGCEVKTHVRGEIANIPAAAPYGLAPELEADFLDWLMRAPSILGNFHVLNFFCDGRLVGVSISRLQETPNGGLLARITHVHAARFDVVDWIVSATVHALVERGAGAIYSRTSCPMTARAMSALGFWRRKQIPAFWWGTDKPPLAAGVFNLTELQGDDGFLFN